VEPQTMRLVFRINGMDEYKALIQKAKNLLDEFDKTWAAINAFEFEGKLKDCPDTDDATMVAKKPVK